MRLSHLKYHSPAESDFIQRSRGDRGVLLVSVQDFGIVFGFQNVVGAAMKETSELARQTSFFISGLNGETVIGEPEDDRQVEL